jgi:hypothetical protein
MIKTWEYFCIVVFSVKALTFGSTSLFNFCKTIMHTQYFWRCKVPHAVLKASTGMCVQVTSSTNKTTTLSINSNCHHSIKHPEQDHSSSSFHLTKLQVKYSAAAATMSTNTITHESSVATHELLVPLKGLAMREEKLFDCLDALWNDKLTGRVKRSGNTNRVTESSSCTSRLAKLNANERKSQRQNTTKTKKAKVGSAARK